MATERSSIIDPDNGAGTDYTSMDAFEDAFGGVANSGDCVGQDEWAHGILRCTGGSVDSQVTVFAGWTATDADHYVLVETVLSEGYRWQGSYPSSGNYYRMDTLGSSAPSVTVTMGYVRLVGIANRCTAAANQGAFEVETNATDARITDCVAWLAGTAADRYGFYIHNISAGTSVLIQNCLAYSFNGTGGVGFRVLANGTHTTYLQHCSAINCTIGFHASVTPSIAQCMNCMTFDTTTAYDGARFGGCVNNGYDNGSDPGTDGLNLSNVAGTALFEDYNNEDYRIKADSPVSEKGTNLLSYSPYACTTDYEGEARYKIPVLGFDERRASLNPGPTAYEQLQDHVSRWSLDAVRRSDTYHPS